MLGSIVTRKTSAVAWECRRCGHRHCWEWDAEDIDINLGWSMDMRCDECDKPTNTVIVQLGKDTYAGAWKNENHTLV